MSQASTEDYDLPGLPDPVDDDYDGDKAVLVIFRQHDAKIWLDGEYALADVQAWCDRDDTHGDGWFAGFYRR